MHNLCPNFRRQFELTEPGCTTFLLSVESKREKRGREIHPKERLHACIAKHTRTPRLRRRGSLHHIRHTRFLTTCSFASLHLQLRSPRSLVIRWGLFLLLVLFWIKSRVCGLQRQTDREARSGVENRVERTTPKTTWPIKGYTPKKKGKHGYPLSRP